MAMIHDFVVVRNINNFMDECTDARGMHAASMYRLATSDIAHSEILLKCSIDDDEESDLFGNNIMRYHYMPTILSNGVTPSRGLDYWGVAIIPRSSLEQFYTATKGIGFDALTDFAGLALSMSGKYSHMAIIHFGI